MIWSALAHLNWDAILIANRGFRRKTLLVKLLRRSVPIVIRLAANIHERLLWAGMMSYLALLVLRLTEHSAGRQCLKQIQALLRRRAVMSKPLTVGKARQALALDYQDNKQDWLTALQGVT